MRPSVVWFLLVGGTAAGVHYLVALLCHGPFGLSPALANTLGFLCAFPVSYLGHHRFSFSGHRATHGQALPRLFAVSLTAFIGNQVALAALLRYTPLPFWLALGLVLAGVAASTFVLGRYWAFAHRP